MSTPAHLALDHRAVPWLFVAAMATTGPHFLHQPLWLSAFAALVLGWAAWMWWRDTPLPSRWLVVFLVVAGNVGIFLEFRTLFGRDPGVSMLVLFMAMKLLELKSRRDATVMVTLGYFLLLTHYFYSQSIPTGLWLLVAMWTVTATQLRLHSGPGTDTRATLRYAAQLCAQALPFMLVLYLLFPRISGPLWGLPQDAHAGLTGLSDTIEPGSIAQLVQSGEIAFRTKFDEAPPAKRQLYWRGPVMEVFDGSTWRPHKDRSTPPQIEALSAPVGYETTLEAHNQRWLLTLDAPTALPANSGLSGNLTANHGLPISTRQRFRFASSLDYRFNVKEQPATLQRNLALPPGRNPRSAALARQWAASEPSAEAIVGKALERFASEFYYTLRPPPLGQHSTDDFLFQTKRGFCEHFATAFVVLMRNAGIPARVVAGYLGGELNPVDGFVVVRQSEAHAWAEVWLQGRGWVRVDPTGAVSPSRIEAGIADALPLGEGLPAIFQLNSDWARNLRYRWEAINNAWNQQILGYDLQRQRELLSRLGFPTPDWQAMITLLAATCAFGLAILLAWTIRQRKTRDPAARLWHKALRQIARRQVNYAPWETPYVIAERVRQLHPELSGPFDQVVDAYLLSRYSPQNNALTTLREAVARLP